MLGRREFLIGGIGLGGALAVPAISQLSSAEQSIDPRSHGARGDGVADDTSAIKAAFAAALEKGLPVDGRGALFAVKGNIILSAKAQPWIRALHLRQLSPANDTKTLCFRNCEGVRIDQLRIDVGAAKNRGYSNESGGLWIDGGSDHNIRNVEVFGHGKNSLVAIWNTKKSTYGNLHVHDAEYDAPTARDDVLQGIFLCRNSDCVLQSPVVSNLHGNASARFPTRYTRGIALCGNTNVSIVDAKVSNVDQGIDISGSDGNRGCTVLRAYSFQCSAVGVKLANSAVGCRVIDSVAERSGLMGFLASGPSEEGLRYKTKDCEFLRCTALDSGYNGFSDSAPHAGFRVERSRFDPQYPMGIRFVGCRAVDRQAVKTMEYGFYMHVEPGAGTAEPNQLIDCHSEGHKRAAKYGSWS
jgi:hypothetical protein